jgi:hypothetical protein
LPQKEIKKIRETKKKKMKRIYFLVIVCFVYMVDYSEQKTCSSLEQDVDYKGNDLLHTFAKSADGIIILYL